MKNLSNQNFFFSIGLFLLGWVGFIYVATNILLLLKLPITNFFTWPINILYFFISYFLLKKTFVFFPFKHWLKIFIFSFLIVVVSILISSFFIDYSFDGQWYHSEATIQILKGWNPNYEHTEKGHIEICINHFSKASWIVGAFIYSITDRYETAKSLNLIWMVSNFFILFYVLTYWIKNIFLKTIICLLVSMNPVFLNVYLSNMLDSQVGAGINIILCFFFIHFKERKINLLPFFYLLIIYMANLKFTVVGYLVIIILAFILYAYLFQVSANNKHFVAHLVLAFMFSITIFSYHTYVHNTIEHGHPFYPFRGKDRFSEMAVSQSLDYRSGNNIINFLKSNFASSSFGKTFTKPVEYKIPFTFSRYELERFGFSGVMVGGFGVWYSGVILISLLFFIILCSKLYKNNKKDLYSIFYLLTIIMITIIINPITYVARYIPQYYFIPIIILVSVHHFFKSKKMFYILLFPLIVNSILIMGYTYFNFVVSNKVKSQLKEMKNSGKEIQVNFHVFRSKRILFDEHKIAYREVEKFEKNSTIDTLYKCEVEYSIK